MVTEEDIDELNIHVVRYRPEELNKLTKITKFNKKEIQLIYRGFKQVGLSIYCVYWYYFFAVGRPISYVDAINLIIWFNNGIQFQKKIRADWLRLANCVSTASIIRGSR